MKKILVTGSHGFIASHTIEVLKAREYKTIGLVRHIGKESNNPWTPDELYIADIRDREAVEKAVSMADGVINLAGILGTQETVQNPYPSVEVNIKGALNVFEAAKIWKVPVVQITVGNYFEKNSYSLTKTCTEGFAHMYAKNNGVNINVVRALNAFGERQKAYPVRKIIPSFITRALNGEKIQIYGNGMQLMDMVAVQDIANILVEILEKTNGENKGNIYEAGTGKGHHVVDIARTIMELCGRNPKEIEFLDMRPGETPGSEVVAKNPYEYKYTNFYDALDKTVKWYKEHEAVWKK